MREDMHKVVIERPRAHSSWGYRAERPRLKGIDIEKLDDLPKKQGMRAPYDSWDTRKDFSDLLGPLRGFLISNVGRPWDKVYSEIRERLNPNSTPQIHIMNHLWQMVERNVKIDADGVMRVNGRYGRYEVSPGDMYVHPRTGILCRVPERRSPWKGKRKTNPDIKVIGPEQELHKINGVWFWALFSDVPLPWINDRDILTYTICIDILGNEVKSGRYRACKKQANSADLKRYGLTNDYKD